MKGDVPEIKPCPHLFRNFGKLRNMSFINLLEIYFFLKKKEKEKNTLVDIGGMLRGEGR